MIGLGKGHLSGAHKAVLGLLLLGPVAIMVCKWQALPTSAFCMQHLSLADLPKRMAGHMGTILFMPFGALMAVFFRHVLGIRLLGPFRAVLLAVAFQQAGIGLGLAFLGLVVAVVVVVRPFLKAMHLPYFARVSVILSMVAMSMLGALLIGNWFHADALGQVAYFPIIVLCLISEGFAKTLTREGQKSALWRGLMTAAVAVLITLLYQIRGVRQFFLVCPEVLLIEVGCIIVMAEYLDWRLLEWANPPVRHKRRASRRDPAGSSISEG